MGAPGGSGGGGPSVGLWLVGTEPVVRGATFELGDGGLGGAGDGVPGEAGVREEYRRVEVEAETP